MVGRVDSAALNSLNLALLESRFVQTPTATEFGVQAGSVQREAQVRLSADLINIQSQTVTSASRLTFLRVADSLNLAASDLNLPEVSVLSPNSFTPDAVAGRLVDFADQLLSQARNTQQFDDIASELEAALAAGFESTRDALSETDSLSGPVDEAVNEIEALVNAGFERLVNNPPENLFPTTVISTVLPANTP